MSINDSTYAEDSNYWETTVHPAKSWAEVEEMLEEFGVNELMTAKGRIEGRLARMIRFNWQGDSYRFEFVAKQCRQPTKLTSFGGKRRTHTDQAEYQMGREAVAFLKAILIAAKSKPKTLFAFQELPGVQTKHPGGLPLTAGELDVSGLAGAMQPLLPASVPDIEIVEAE